MTGVRLAIWFTLCLLRVGLLRQSMGACEQLLSPGPVPCPDVHWCSTNMSLKSRTHFLYSFAHCPLFQNLRVSKIWRTSGSTLSITNAMMDTQGEVTCQVSYTYSSKVDLR